MPVHIMMVMMPVVVVVVMLMVIMMSLFAQPTADITNLVLPRRKDRFPEVPQPSSPLDLRLRSLPAGL